MNGMFLFLSVSLCCFAKTSFILLVSSTTELKYLTTYVPGDEEEYGICGNITIG